MDFFIEKDGIMVNIDIEELERIGLEACKNIGEPSKELIENIPYILKTEYQRNRQPNYPSISDQLDMLWHAIDSGTLDKTSDFYLKLKEVKELYPKPLEEQNDNQ